MDILPQVIITGIGLGVIYGLVGLTFTAIFNASKVINFSQGDFLMLGGLLAVYLVGDRKIPLPIAMLIVLVLMAVIGIAMYYLIVGPLVKKGSTILAVVSTLALSTIFTGGVGLLTRHQFFHVNAYWDVPAINVGSARLPPQYIILAGMVAVLVLGYWYFSNKTHIGLALRATGFDSEAGRMIGIPTSMMITLAFVISAGMGGLSGLFVAPVTTPNAYMGLPLLLRGFVAAVVGGMGNAYAALVGGLAVGLLSTTLSAYTSAAIGEVATFSLLVMVLLFRPQGIFGEPE